MTMTAYTLIVFLTGMLIGASITLIIMCSFSSESDKKKHKTTYDFANFVSRKKDES